MNLPEVSLRPETVAFLQSGPKKLLIGGEWVSPIQEETFPTLNPATGERLADISLAQSPDIDAAVTAARATFSDKAWAGLSGAERGALLWRLADLIEENTEMLAELETLDNGKPLRVSQRGDIPYAVRHFRYYAGWAGKNEGATIPVSIPNQLVYTIREPVGVVGLIIPWNFPLLMAAWKLAPALACGNTTILKPAEETPLTALLLGELILEAGFPRGTVNIVTGPGEPTGAAIASHQGIDKVAFTGSTKVGRKIMAAAASSNLKRISLELGGKSPNVIFADADLSGAIKGATWAAFSNNGQECSAGSRLFIEDRIYGEVLDGLVQQSSKLRVGAGFTPGVHVGPLVSAQQMERVLGFVNEGWDEGIEFLIGGERLGGELKDGFFLGPTIFATQDDSSSLVREEIFGPVLAVSRFSDWDELVSRANDSRYGLAAGIWTKDIRKAHRFAHAIRAGTIWINEYGLFDAAAPFGGYKESGVGREFGKEGLDLYSELKTVWVRT